MAPSKQRGLLAAETRERHESRLGQISIVQQLSARLRQVKARTSESATSEVNEAEEFLPRLIG